MSPQPEAAVTLQLTHIFYRQFSRSYSNDAWGVFCRRICLGESFWGRSSGFGVAPRWDGDLSETSPTARSMVSRSALPYNPLVGLWMKGYNSTINGGLAFGSESVLESRYVHVAETGFDCNSATNPHLHRQFSRSYSGDAWGVLSSRICFFWGGRFGGDRVELGWRRFSP